MSIIGTKHTVKLPVELSPEQEQMVINRCNSICAATNTAIRLNTLKITNMIKLTYALYPRMRSLYPDFPATDVQQCIRRAASMQASLVTRRLRLERHLSWYASKNRKVPKKLQKQYDAVCTATPHLQQVTSLPLTAQQCRWDTKHSTVHVHGFTKCHPTQLKFYLHPYAQQQLAKGGTLGACHITYHKSERRWYLHATLTSFQDVEHNSHQPVLGVDLGIVNLATTSTGTMVEGEDTWQHCEKFLRQRAALQAKGTRSAKRKLRRTCSRYSRYTRDRIHCVAKQVVAEAQAHGCQAIVLEALKLRSCEISNPYLRKAVARWPYASLQQCIQYKALDAGIDTVYIFPANTSITCSRCGYKDKGNRIGQEVFSCKRCGYSAHADANAAQNIMVLGYTKILDQLQLQGKSS